MKTIPRPFFLLAIITLLSAFALSSCKGDDDEELSESGIVGKWTCNDHYYQGEDTFVFKKNGTYTWSYKGEADWFENQEGTYTFDGSLLVITNSHDTTWIYVVMSLSDSTMVIMDEDGYYYTYRRR